MLSFLLISVILTFAACYAKVLVIGGTGRVGSAVVRNLVAAGIPTNVLSRKAEATAFQEGVNIFGGDVGSMNDIVEASKGCDAIIAVHGVTPPRVSKVTDFLFSPNKDRNHPYNVNYIAMKKIVAAMKTNNVTKLVRITGSFVDKSPFLPFVALFNLLLSRTVKWHQMGEKVIREAGINYTVIRPPGIRDNVTVAEPRNLVLIPGDTGGIKKSPGQISVLDLASLCVLAVSDQRLVNATVICNTETAAEGDQGSSDGPNSGGSWERALSSRSSWKDSRRIIPGRHNLAIAVYVVLLPVACRVLGLTLSAAARSVWSLFGKLRF